MNATGHDIEAKDIKRLLLRAYRRYRSGEITEAAARQETFLLNSVLKAIETTDLEARLQKIESLMEGNK
jgi:hypothetical protein